MAVILFVAGLLLILANMPGQDASTPASSTAAGQPAGSDEEIGEAPDQLIRPLFERLVRGGVGCEQLVAMYTSPESGRRAENGSCTTTAGELVVIMAFKDAEDRAAEIASFTESSRDLGFAPLIVYGDTWAVTCEDGMTLSAVQRILGGTIAT